MMPFGPTIAAIRSRTGCGDDGFPAVLAMRHCSAVAPPLARGRVEWFAPIRARAIKFPSLRAQSRLSVDIPITTRKLTRWQASGLHLLISIAIAAAALAVTLLVWYPRPLFEASGGTGLLYILVGVDVAIGPLITLVV